MQAGKMKSMHVCICGLTTMSDMCESTQNVVLSTHVDLAEMAAIWAS